MSADVDEELVSWSSRLGFDRDRVAELLETAPSSTALRPAIRKLSQDQRRLIERFIDGFATREEFVLWCQDAGVQTLGELPASWCRARSFSGVDLSMLITDPRMRAGWSPDDTALLTQEEAADARRVVVAVDLLPACVAALKSFRWSAVEYEDAENSPRPEGQQHPAMRPALSRLDERQEWVLESFLGGFDSRDQLTAWFQEATEATYGELPDGFSSEIHNRAAVREHLLDGESDESLRWREHVAVRYLLPACFDAVREVSQRAGEEDATESTVDQSPMKYK